MDVSVNVEIAPNKKALTTVRNKKKEMQDLDNHAFENSQDTDNTVIEGLQAAVELEDELIVSKDAMYKVSYVLRVSAPSVDVLEDRVDELMELYSDSNIKLARPFGDMLGLAGEFIPTSKRYLDDYVQYVTADFLLHLGSVRRRSLERSLESISVSIQRRDGMFIFDRNWLHRE